MSVKIPENTFTFNHEIQFGETNQLMTADAGLLTFVEFLERTGFFTIVKTILAEDGDEHRQHPNWQLVVQSVLQMATGRLTDMSANTFRSDPVLKAVLGQEGASQPTLSRFWRSECPGMTDKINEILQCMAVNFRVQGEDTGRETEVTWDLDSTLTPTYGAQEEAAFNHHYGKVGYHPLVMFADNGDLLGVELRPGTKYCCNGAADFVEAVLERQIEIGKDLKISLRSDSGFATPEIYELMEKHDFKYSVKLKMNLRLLDPVVNVIHHVLRCQDYGHDIERYGEFMYQAESWSVPRRVVFCIRRPRGTFLAQEMCIVTNRTGTPEEEFEYYRGRGNMENHIKEFKSDFCQSLPHAAMGANELHFAVQALAYVLMAAFKRMCLPEKMRTATARTIQTTLIRIPAKISRSGRRTVFLISRHSMARALLAQVTQNVFRLRSA